MTSVEDIKKNIKKLDKKELRRGLLTSIMARDKLESENKQFKEDLDFQNKDLEFQNEEIICLQRAIKHSQELIGDIQNGLCIISRKLQDAYDGETKT